MNSESSAVQQCQGPGHSVSLGKCQRQMAHKAPRQPPPSCRCSLALQGVPFLPAATHAFLLEVNALPLAQSTPATLTGLPSEEKVGRWPRFLHYLHYLAILSRAGTPGFGQGTPVLPISVLLSKPSICLGCNVKLACAQRTFPAGADPGCTPC